MDLELADSEVLTVLRRLVLDEYFDRAHQLVFYRMCIAARQTN